MYARPAVASCVVLIFASFLRAQSGLADSNFRIEIQPDIDGKPSFTITNLFNDTLTACVIRFSLSSKPTWHSELDWDPIIQNNRVNRPDTRPLEAGASMTMYLAHAIGESLPDKVEVVAATWADEETFGDPAWVKVILDHRASLALAYKDAIGLLQQGLDENWTRDQYLEAVLSKSWSSGPKESILSTLRGNRSLDKNPQLLRSTVKNLQAHFEQNLDLLRRTKPTLELF